MGSDSNNETIVLNKKNYFEKFIEEFDFAELSTQAKHWRVLLEILRVLLMLVFIFSVY